MTQNKKLKKVEIISESELAKAQYIKTAMVKAIREDGRKIFWETSDGHSSVHIMVDNKDEERLEIVAQVRVPIKVNFPDSDGVTLEACAGLVDKDTSIIQITKEELQEEMGYDVDIKDIIPVREYCSNVGKSGQTVYTFKCEVTNDMKTSEGGGLESEDIAIITIPYNEVNNFIRASGKYSEVFTDATTLFLVQDWLINNISKV